MVQTVLFACVHNAGRSQMANALFNLLADPAEAKGISAGTTPGERVHPECVTAMKELGVDIATEKPQLLTPELATTANFLVTMGCGEACPYVPGLKREDWPLEDPKGKSPEKVKIIRDDVQQRVLDFISRQGWQKKSTDEEQSRLNGEDLQIFDRIE